MDEPTSPNNRDEAIERLTELVLDHLGIPRPKQSAHIQTLQDELLPAFMELARHAWLASSPIPLRTGMLANEQSHPVYRYLQAATETQPKEIHKLKDILEELGVDALLEAVASFPDVSMVGELAVDAYDDRLLREAGHRNPSTAAREYLHYATKHPEVLADVETGLVKAEKAMLRAHGDINIIVNQIGSTTPTPEPAKNAGPTAADTTAAARPKRIKLFAGLGKLASGFVLLSGNAIVIPTVAIGSLTALPVLASLAAGIAAVGDGVSHLLHEGE